MDLVIVESPTKAKTISNFLGKDFKVESSFGHVRDLPKSKIGIDIENHFKPHYIIPQKAKKQVEKLASIAKKAKTIYYATDGDREGEAIAWHLNYILKNKYKIAAKTHRIIFHEITREALNEAFKEPHEINTYLFDAQQARRILDRLVGYKLSPFLWQKVMRGLSAGRVQSVAVRLIVEREAEIKEFKPEEYWSVDGLFSAHNQQFQATLHKLDDKKLDKFDLNNKEQIEKLGQELKLLEYSIADLIDKAIKKRPYPPYKTSTLQQDAHNKLGYSSKQTMLLAQQLYEGIELKGNEVTGLITYMRTDSLSLSNKFIDQAKNYLEEHFGTKYSFKKPRIFKNKTKGAQEAHEAIRPTNIYLPPESIQSHLNPKQYKLYSLIWHRALASLMPEAILNQRSIDIAGLKNSQKKAGFKAIGSTISFDGFLKVYPLKVSEITLPLVTVGEPVSLDDLFTTQHFTEPPPRFNDASLVKELEKKGIGRPSTYAPTIDTIQKRNYVNRDENKRFMATDIGIAVTELLKKHFPHIVDFNFTAHLEDELDEISHNKIKWEKVISDFYTPFSENLEKKYDEVEKKALPVEKTDKTCPQCNNHLLVIKQGRFGKFMACPGFPECKYTEPIENGKPGSPDTEARKILIENAPSCEQCGKKMIPKEGRYGQFFACPDYPACKNTKRIEQKINMACPDCTDGQVIVKRTRSGRIFYGCNNYPTCTYAKWKKPTLDDKE